MLNVKEILLITELGLLYMLAKVTPKSSFQLRSVPIYARGAGKNSSLKLTIFAKQIASTGAIITISATGEVFQLNPANAGFSMSLLARIERSHRPSVLKSSV